MLIGRRHARVTERVRHGRVAYQKRWRARLVRR
jgi:hypothetical protein